MRIDMRYFPQWAGLLAARLSPSTPLAPTDVQDDDPKPYRHDSRIWFEAFPNRLHRTHMAVLACESDDDGYQLYFKLVELPDDELKKEVEVYRRKLSELKPQTFTFSSNEIKRVGTYIKKNIMITVIISEVKTVV
jgi:hypothetical protein